MGKINKIIPYFQTGDLTCLACCGIIIKQSLNEKYVGDVSDESKLHNQIKYWNNETGCYPKLAEILVDEGFEVDYFIDNLPRRPFFLEKETFKKFIEVYNNSLKKALDKGVKLRQGEISIDHIREYLDKGNLLIALIKRPNELLLHNIVLNGYEKEFIYYFDPLNGPKKIPYKTLLSKMDISYIKNYLSIGRKENEKTKPK